MLESLGVGVQEPSATLLKKTPTQVFSREYYQIFKNSFLSWTETENTFLRVFLKDLFH